MMFERFTDQARRIVVLAQSEATDSGSAHVGTEHLLLGLLQDRNGIAGEALHSVGISLEAARRQVEELVGHGSGPFTANIPFTPRANTVLELSMREAIRLGDDYIGTEHLLLGLVREGEGVGARVLIGLGVDLDRIRTQVLSIIGERGARPSEPWEPGTTRSVIEMRLAGIEARLAAIEKALDIRRDDGSE